MEKQEEILQLYPGVSVLPSGNYNGEAGRNPSTVPGCECAGSCEKSVPRQRGLLPNGSLTA